MAKFAKKFNSQVMNAHVRQFWRGLQITAHGAVSTAMLASCGWWLWGVHEESGWVAVGKFILAVLALTVALLNIYITGAGKRANRGEGA